MKKFHRNKEFIDIFFKTFGINRRIYSKEDVFFKRDRRADEKKYNNFLKNPNILSDKQYMFLVRLEFCMFVDIVSYFFPLVKENIDSIEFIYQEIMKININAKLFYALNLNIDIFINLFSFQLALIIENMIFNEFDVALFEKCLEEETLIPFLEKCKEVQKVKTDKDLSNKFSYIYENLKYDLKQDIKKTPIKEHIQEGTFKKDLSNWKKNKDYPSFLKMLVIISAIKKENSEEKRVLFYQLFIIRALLYIKEEFSIKDNIKEIFKQKLCGYRKLIKHFYSKRREDKIFKYQNRYLVYDSSDDCEEIKDRMELIFFRFKKFFKYNKKEMMTFNENINHMFQDMKQDIEKSINGFSKCKTKEDYIKLLEESTKINVKNHLLNIFYDGVFDVIKFIISIKIEDKKTFNKYYRCIDRNSGMLLSHFRMKKDLPFYINMLKDEKDIVKCINLLIEYLKKLSTS